VVEEVLGNEMMDVFQWRKRQWRRMKGTDEQEMSIVMDVSVNQRDVPVLAERKFDDRRSESYSKN
jgi:hypothetical protein